MISIRAGACLLFFALLAVLSAAFVSPAFGEKAAPTSGNSAGVQKNSPEKALRQSPPPPVPMFPGVPLPSGGFELQTEINRQELLLLAELPRSGSGLLPFIPFPFSVTLRDNLLPASAPTLPGFEFITRVHFNSDNAPAAGGELRLLWGPESGRFMAATGVQIITGLETNIYAARVEGSYRGGRLFFSLGTEGGLRLDIPENELFYALSAVSGAVLIPDLISVRLGYRGNAADRNAFEALLRCSFLSFWLEGGASWRRFEAADDSLLLLMRAGWRL